MWTERNSHCHHFGLRFGALGTRLHATRHPLIRGPRVPYLALDMPPLPNPAGAIVQALSETVEESSESQACRQSLIAALLPVLARSLDLGQPIGEHSARQFRRICSYLQENLHQAIDRYSVARHFELDPSTLSRLFSKVGPGFNNYLNQLRIDMARQVLRSSNESVEAVAAACGFTTSSYFIKRFRQSLGCTPQQWRARQVGG
jgi:AraC-like DNA-binding protein